MRKKLNMIGRSLLRLRNISDEEFLSLMELTGELKAKKKRGENGNALFGKHLALVFEKMSTRTRCAASVAVADEGGRAEYLSSRETHFGKKESTADSARVLGRMFDGILFRGYHQETVELLARHSGVPVWNGLTDVAHPTQTMADVFTILETFGKLDGLKVVYVGDGRNNVANSLMVGCAKVGMEFVNCTPPELNPPEFLVQEATKVAATNGCKVIIERDPVAAVKGANVIYTDVWISMGEESKEEERISLLRPYQVDAKLMRATGNLESNEVIFLHCLPAFHDAETEVTRELGALEVSDEVFESSYSRVFDLSENRMHTMKALFVASLGGLQ